jgi:hypothetical protein
MLSDTLPALALDVAACLPTGEPGASVPDLADDCFEHPLFADPAPEVLPAERRRRITAALNAIRQALPANAGGRGGLLCYQPKGAPAGAVFNYAFGVDAADWIRPQLQEVLNGRD